MASWQQGLLLGFHLIKLDLPKRRVRLPRYLHCSYLVLGTIGGPIAQLRRHDIRARLREMEGRVNDTGLDPFALLGPQASFTGSADDVYPVTILNPSLGSIFRMNLQLILVMPDDVFRPASLGPDVVLRQNPAGGQD